VAENPYEDRFPVNRTLPEQGRPREELLAELATMAEEEDKAWESGKCSGTMYCGDHEHYAFMNQAFGLFAHVNALQRDMCPSQTKFEGEIIAMTLDLLHAEAVTDTEPVGLVTTGGTGSILHAMISYREQGEAKGVIRVRGCNCVRLKRPAVPFWACRDARAVGLPLDPDNTRLRRSRKDDAVRPQVKVLEPWALSPSGQ